MNTYFFTGFPGFLSSYLIKEIINERFPLDKIYLCILPTTRSLAEEKINELVRTLNVSPATFELVEGDITKENLDFHSTISKKILSSITHVYHLAAIYDLSVPYDPAYQVNVLGTKHVNEWLLKANNLKHYTYFSTAYVAGKREGNILETELKHEAGFKNHYESTKYEAERLVAQEMDRLPVTIIRPSIVVGNSMTGETAKFDGPYFIMNLFERLRGLPIIPYIGRRDAETNFVPVDYVVRATVFLSHYSNAIGKTYHLTDPNPYRTREVYRMLMEALIGQAPAYTIPLQAARLPLSFKPVRRWFHVQKETIPYFIYDCHFDTTQTTEDLKGTEISCPDFETVIPNIITYYRANKDNPEKRLSIS